MQKTKVIQFEMTYEEYLALVVAATAEITSSKEYLADEVEHDGLYTNTRKRVEALEAVLKKMDDRVSAVILEDANKRYEYMKG